MRCNGPSWGGSLRPAFPKVHGERSGHEQSFPARAAYQSRPVPEGTPGVRDRGPDGRLRGDAGKAGQVRGQKGRAEPSGHLSPDRGGGDLSLPFGYADAAVAIDPLVLLLLGLAIDVVVGEMPFLFGRIPHPVAAIGLVIDVLERGLNRPGFGFFARRALGVLAVGGLVFAAAVLGRGICWLDLQFLELFLVVILVAQRSLHDHVEAVRIGLDRGGLDGGRAAVAQICGRDPLRLDTGGVSRAAIESCAENFSDGIVAPVFWYVLFGLPGMLVYKTVNTLDSMIGHRSERFLAFGYAAARLDDLMNLVPARLAGVFLALASLTVPGARPGRAFIVMVRDARKHRSPNSGWPEAAMAGALGLSLAGPRHYPGYSVSDEWIGDGRAEAEARDIGRALHVFKAACMVNAAVVAGIWLAG
ncbi:MAG: cobalamin biosynthesis protein CobD [Alphaproteobacteria bacterium]|nr:cobalamin biosynthesis protein CobD [Alphaproteobacteria bacterium]